MKFRIGDMVRLKETGEIGKVVRILKPFSACWVSLSEWKGVERILVVHENDIEPLKLSDDVLLEE